MHIVNSSCHSMLYLRQSLTQRSFIYVTRTYSVRRRLAKAVDIRNMPQTNVKIKTIMKQKKRK